MANYGLQYFHRVWRASVSSFQSVQYLLRTVEMDFLSHSDANVRLQASIESLLERMAGLSRLEEPIESSQSELLQTSPTDGAISQLKADNERLEERVTEESTERQRLAQELDRTQGKDEAWHHRIICTTRRSQKTYWCNVGQWQLYWLLRYIQQQVSEKY